MRSATTRCSRPEDLRRGGHPQPGGAGAHRARLPRRGGRRAGPVVSATVAGVRVTSVYAPNGQAVDSPGLPPEARLVRRVRRWLDLRHKDDLLVVCGDFNVAREERDVLDPKLWEGQTLFQLPQRAALRHAVEFGLEDTFRRLHPEPGRQLVGLPDVGFQKRGLRLDHVYATPPLARLLGDAGIDRESCKGIQPSDHAPSGPASGCPASRSRTRTGSSESTAPEERTDPGSTSRVRPMLSASRRRRCPAGRRLRPRSEQTEPAPDWGIASASTVAHLRDRRHRPQLGREGDRGRDPGRRSPTSPFPGRTGRSTDARSVCPWWWASRRPGRGRLPWSSIEVYVEHTRRSAR